MNPTFRAVQISKTMHLWWSIPRCVEVCLKTNPSNLLPGAVRGRRCRNYAPQALVISFRIDGSDARLVADSPSYAVPPG